MNSFENLMEAIDFLPQILTNSREYTGSPERQGVSGTRRHCTDFYVGNSLVKYFSILGKLQLTSLLMCVL